MHRNAVRESIPGITFCGTSPGQIFEMLLGSLARWHRLIGIFVFDLVERETASFGDVDCASNGVGKTGEQPRHFRRGFKMPFGIDREPQTRFANSAFLANAGEHISERPTLRYVIKNFINSNQRRIQTLTKFSQ